MELLLVYKQLQVHEFHYWTYNISTLRPYSDFCTLPDQLYSDKYISVVWKHYTVELYQ